ncbi:MAG TPA: hypothetical protein VGT61_14200 [Thermomicrobiales bacterium]|nr:hypothetical protein [Thermomicrobiales bacterium]
MDPASPPPDQRDAIRHHEIVRDLTIIRAQAQLMLRRLDPDSPASRDAADRLRSIIEATERIVELHR